MRAHSCNSMKVCQSVYLMKINLCLFIYFMLECIILKNLLSFLFDIANQMITMISLIKQILKNMMAWDALSQFWHECHAIWEKCNKLWNFPSLQFLEKKDLFTVIQLNLLMIIIFGTEIHPWKWIDIGINMTLMKYCGYIMYCLLWGPHRWLGQPKCVASLNKVIIIFSLLLLLLYPQNSMDILFTKDVCGRWVVMHLQLGKLSIWAISWESQHYGLCVMY